MLLSTKDLTSAVRPAVDLVSAGAAAFEAPVDVVAEMVTRVVPTALIDVCYANMAVFLIILETKCNCF